MHFHRRGVHCTSVTSNAQRNQRTANGRPYKRYYKKTSRVFTRDVFRLSKNRHSEPVLTLAWESPNFCEAKRHILPLIRGIATPACGLVRNDR